jgi:hypothetical protein
VPKISSVCSWTWRLIKHVRRLTEAQEVWQHKVKAIYAREDFTPVRTRNSSCTTVLSVIAIGGYASKYGSDPAQLAQEMAFR